jgi:hypothetical protein
MGVCGGAVAVDCGEAGEGDGEGAGAVLAAGLVRCGEIGAREAAAWVRLAWAVRGDEDTNPVAGSAV